MHALNPDAMHFRRQGVLAHRLNACIWIWVALCLLLVLHEHGQVVLEIICADFKADVNQIQMLGHICRYS